MALLTPYSQSFPGLVAAENPETSAFGYHDLTLKEWITRSTDSTRATIVFTVYLHLDRKPKTPAGTSRSVQTGSW